MAITLTNIPKVMRANRMPMGAALMESWFLRPTAINPAFGTPDTSTITMKWALGFKRAKDVHDKIITDKIWVNAAAQKVIEKKLRAQGKLTSSPQNFGNLSQSQPTLSSEQINQRVVGMSDMTQTLDDMDAALGNFVLQVVIAGTVTPKGKDHLVEIKEVGIFVEDNYDFEGSQFLGSWDDTANTVSRAPGLSGNVSNGDFRDWRAKNGMGGDYKVYSDVMKLTLSAPDSFTISPAVTLPPFRWEPGPKW